MFLRLFGEALSVTESVVGRDEAGELETGECGGVCGVAGANLACTVRSKRKSLKEEYEGWFSM